MFVYADNSATTQLSQTAYDAMLPWLRENYGNPSSVYKIARDAKRAMELAREQIAASLGARPEEIYFTSGGTEADNTAVYGALQASKRGKHIITSAIEHDALLRSVEYHTKGQTAPTILPVDSAGRVSGQELKDAIRDDTALVSIMAANNEIGTVQDVSAIGGICREKGVWFHTDAVQMAGHLPIHVENMQIDMLSLSGHKLHGPRGVGVLYVRRGIRLPPLLHGGGHERGRRSGTENVAGIVGLAAALTEMTENMQSYQARAEAMRDTLIEGILKIPYSFLTGDPHNRLPGLASFVFECVEGESLVLNLDFAGICASSGSACSSASLDPSHVLLGIGLPHEIAHGSLRLSLSHVTTEEEVSYLVEKVAETVTKTRSLSPLWDMKEQKPTERFWSK